MARHCRAACTVVALYAAAASRRAAAARRPSAQPCEVRAILHRRWPVAGLFLALRELYATPAHEGVSPGLHHLLSDCRRSCRRVCAERPELALARALRAPCGGHVDCRAGRIP